MQSEKFGARISVPVEAVGFEPDRDGYRIQVGAEDGLDTRTIIVATGARYRRLGVPGAADLEGVSVHYAATQVEAMLCAGDPVAVVGGGNSAGQASLFLSRHAAKVSLLVRSTDLGADMSRYLVDEIRRHDSIDVRLHTEVRALVADSGVLREVVTVDRRTGRSEASPARALFVFIGTEPHVGWLQGRLPWIRGGSSSPVSTPRMLG